MAAHGWIIPSLTWIKKLRFNEESSTCHNFDGLGFFFPAIIIFQLQKKTFPHPPSLLVGFLLV